MKKHEKKYEMGIVGLGVMGQNLLMNLSDHKITVAGYDKDTNKIKGTKFETVDLKQFIASLKTPKVIMIMVPAGAAVDSVISDLLPHLKKGDILIDGGNSYFKDTNLRQQSLSKKGIFLIGMGISGGEEGARHGPSMMPGGDKKAYEKIRRFFEKAAAKADGDPCIAYLGPGSAGHFVKTVHNGIEYGLMQLISETYDFLKRGLQLPDEKIGPIYEKWNKGILNSYLLEITSNIFRKKDEKTRKLLLDSILDVAKQKGTGMWTSQSSMELQVPSFTIDAAVEMRDLSMWGDQRKAICDALGSKIKAVKENQTAIIKMLSEALYIGMIGVYAQGMSILRAASQTYKYNLDLTTVASIWRGGCIIRSALLENIMSAYSKQPKLANLILDPFLAKQILKKEKDLRAIIKLGVEIRIPIPGFTSVLSYLDAYRSCWLPATLIQAQRDYFGAHTYERIDSKGTFHTQWD